jgi:hypothetical protein
LRWLQTCLEAWDICGDSFTTFEVYSNQQKPWVQSVLVPYITFWGVASILSVINIALKLKQLACLIRARAMPAAATVTVDKLGNVIVPRVLGANPAVVQLHQRFVDFKEAQTKFLASIALLLCEGAKLFGPPALASLPFVVSRKIPLTSLQICPCWCSRASTSDPSEMTPR